MKAMALKEHCEIDIKDGNRRIPSLPLKEAPLESMDIPIPECQGNEILISVKACGVCHTEIDEIEARLHPPQFPIILGHEIVGRVEATGPEVKNYKKGDRVGVAWINSSCGHCRFCERGDENLCDEFRATGLHAHGGYAEFTVVHEEFAYPIPAGFSDTEAGPLLCAGVIGYRALRLTGIKKGEILGLFGFGASAHIAIQVARHWGCDVFVFTRPGQKEHQELAKKLGASWVGVTGETPPRPLRSAIDFTPVGTPVKEGLRIIEKGGRMVVNAIRKIEPIPELEYSTHLWYEKELKSVANVTRRDAKEFLPLAEEIGIRPHVQEFALEDANKALVLLKQGKMHGAGVLRIQ